MLRTLPLAILLATIPLSSLWGQVDSVKLRIERLDGVERVQEIIASMGFLATTDRKVAVTYGEEVVPLLDTLQLSDEDRIDFLYKLGTSYSSVGPEESLVTIFQNLRTEKSSFALSIADLLESYLAQSKGDAPKALELTQSANAYFESVEDAEYLARTYYTIASLQYELGNYEESLLAVDKSINNAIQVNQIPTQGSGLTLKGALMREKGRTEEARALYNESLALNEKYQLKVGVARVSNQIGIFEAQQGNHDRAAELFTKAKNIHAELGNTSSLIQMINNLGVVSRMKGNYDSAALYYAEVVKISEEKGEKASMALGLSNLGVVFIDFEQYAEAVGPLKRALALYEEMENKPGQSRVLNNLGNAYRLQEEFEIAIDYLEQSLAIKKEIGRTANIAVSLHNLGDLYREMELFAEAEPYYYQSIDLKKELNDRGGLIASYFGIAKLKRNYQQPEQVIAYMDSSIVLAREIDDQFQTRRLLGFLASFYEEQQDFKRAYETHVLYKAANDSLFSSENETVIAKIQEEFKTKEQQQAIELLEQKRQNQNQLVIALIAGAILLVVIIVIVYNRYRLKNQANRLIQEKSQQLERSNNELKELSEFKQGMTSMIAHDIKNPLNSIIGLSNQLDKKVGSDIAKAGDAILRLITNMLDVEKFERSTPVLNLSGATVSELVSEAQLAVELLLHDKSIVLNTKIESDARIHVDKELIVRVLVNLLSNAIKFSPSNNTIKLDSTIIMLDGVSFVKISVSDNGIGIPKEDQPYLFEKFYQSNAKKSGLAPSTGLGLTFCKMAVQAHDGTISVESETGKGSTFSFTLKTGTQKVEKVISNETDSALTLTEEEAEVLKRYSGRLRELKVHNVSAIMAILDEIEELHLDTLWPKELRSAVQYSNKDQYEVLVKMID